MWFIHQTKPQILQTNDCHQYKRRRHKLLAFLKFILVVLVEHVVQLYEVKD